LGVSYYRRLSLAEQINQGQPPVLMIPVDVARRRSTAGQVIPLQQDMPETMQYRPPADLTKRLQIPSYVRHAATLRKPKPGERLVSIRMYRVEHSMISPSQFTALEMDPYDPDLYRPFFLGEFDEEGRLLNEKDPLLYWLVPIIRRELSPAEAALGQQKIPHWKFGNLRRGDVEYTDYSLLHATGKLHWDATTEQEGRDTNAKQEGGGR
jgi:hypothetical protein